MGGGSSRDHAESAFHIQINLNFKLSMNFDFQEAFILAGGGT